MFVKLIIIAFIQIDSCNDGNETEIKMQSDYLTWIYLLVIIIMKL